MLACEGTAASQFIENGWYQLDDSSTGLPVNEKGDIVQLQNSKGSEYEVTIVLSKLDIAANLCPRCHHLQSESCHLADGWLRWYGRNYLRIVYGIITF